ncbi:leucine-rich repeat-containing protein 18-like [Entelurus aequoreus]|uniref:leucine-rich repeat-containing protein 18-like n=1 Tax=Entelurus aequoreus TaxID=161455 RepID=UPI002B1D2AAC|nr:leucine-rich repeat-containing protein 18-like [Entelurus aequoreus]XP_061910923.1 leucine-rich repeat-containing protein 18-like [Entelurus aequoreus]XP_061910924.1 leucine-rich repeat-containing protein 18-like [Entelurus aequoreus]XP_061910926.1 leucine-rich repeat-containing protein 18-like [Entelurus aequoreus]XP_061910928.1 leucine-rich repeat-containing protein 18-like [Entelurus aequoreus]XP_061910929.1 leucine-rich repeat-containing protein 18-like [Entelurus aequoreus]
MPKSKKGGKPKARVFDLQMAQNCIELTPDGKQRLNLSFKGFTIVPECIDKLCRIDEILLSRNLIKKLPDFFDVFNNVHNLDLHSNYLEVLPPSIGLLKNLLTLNCCNNRLTHVPKEIGLLQNLRTLHLGLNRLQTLPSTIGDLKELTYIGLSDNKFAKVPKCLAQLQNLKKANLDRNPIPPPQVIKPTPIPKMFHLIKAGDLCDDCRRKCRTERKKLAEALNMKEQPSAAHVARPEIVT